MPDSSWLVLNVISIGYRFKADTMGRIVNLFTWELGVSVRTGIDGGPSGKNGGNHQSSMEDLS